jgi:hypothetical protein
VIPRAHIQAWSATTPWREPRQIEQDLIICRALCDIFCEPFLADRLAFGAAVITEFRATSLPGLLRTHA